MLTIGAVDENGNRASFSSVGPTFDGRIKPDVMAMGYLTYVADSNGGYKQGSGTSFSCPVMAGMVACFWQALPKATAAEIRDAVRKCASRSENPDPKNGYGIPDFWKGVVDFPASELPSEVSEIISVFPNPSSGNVRVALKEGVKAELSIYDHTGRFIFTHHFNGLNHSSLEGSLNELGAGIYFIKVSSEVGNQTLKLVKTK